MICQPSAQSPGPAHRRALERLFHCQKLLRQAASSPVIRSRSDRSPRACIRRQGRHQRGDVEHLARGVVLGKVDKAVVGPLGQRRVGVAVIEITVARAP